MLKGKTRRQSPPGQLYPILYGDSENYPFNSLNPERPMVTIDQVCWNEMNIDGKLDLYCEDEECRWYEQVLRRILLQWEYFPVDMVTEGIFQIILLQL